MKTHCPRVRTLLSAYLDETLPARDAGHVAGHLARCAACRHELQALESAVSALDRVLPATPPIDLWERMQKRLVAQGTHASSRPKSNSGPSSPLSRQSRWAMPTLAAFRPALVPVLIGSILAVGVLGYRLGVQSGAPGPGVLAGALVSRSTPGPDRSRDGGEDAEIAVPRSSRHWAAIVPPEATMKPWVGAGPGGNTQGDPALSPAADATPSEALARVPATSVTDAFRQHESDGGLASKPKRARGDVNPRHSAPRVAESGTDAAGATAGFERVEAMASAHLAGALQASIEEVTRRQVSDEVALLAQALKLAEARPTGDTDRKQAGENRE